MIRSVLEWGERNEGDSDVKVLIVMLTNQTALNEIRSMAGPINTTLTTTHSANRLEHEVILIPSGQRMPKLSAGYWKVGDTLEGFVAQLWMPKNQELHAECILLAERMTREALTLEEGATMETTHSTPLVKSHLQHYCNQVNANRKRWNWRKVQLEIMALQAAHDEQVSEAQAAEQEQAKMLVED